MHIGEGCGIAAVLAVKDAVAVQDVDVREVQKALTGTCVLFHHPSTKCPSELGE